MIIKPEDVWVLIDSLRRLTDLERNTRPSPSDRERRAIADAVRLLIVEHTPMSDWPDLYILADRIESGAFGEKGGDDV